MSAVQKASPSLGARKTPLLTPLVHPAAPAGSTTWECTNWDLNTQQPHGGQEWSSLANFCEDFSVTTNFLGPPWSAMAAATATLEHLHHYPAANFEPALTDLAEFLGPGDAKEMHTRLLLGNGASELIDLVIRVGAHQGNFYVQDDQYKEYARAALAAGREKLAEVDDECSLIAIVNPCNPTGEYKNPEQMKAFLEETCKDHTTVLLDESMQPWVGPHWREDSMVKERDWVKRMCDERDIRVFDIHSWTKIWSCPGLRLGSIVAPTEGDIATLKEHQVPWSLNVAALGFLSAAVKDIDFMEQTWAMTPLWRKMEVDKLTEMFPTWEFLGEPMLSWIWINTKDAGLAEKATKLCKAAGVPIRWGGLGYQRPEFLRVAVRSPHKQKVLWKALERLSVASKASAVDK